MLNTTKLSNSVKSSEIGLNKTLIALIISSFLIFAPSIKAQEEATNSSLTNKIKERLEQTAQEGLDVIKDQIKTNSSQPRKQAYIGTITEVNNNQITLKYKAQELKVNLHDYTDYSKTSQENLSINDFIIAMGFTDPNSKELSAHKITFVSNPTFNHPRQIISGKVKEVDGNSIAIDGKSLKVSSKTNLVIKGIGSGNTEDIQLEDALFSIVTVGSDGDIDTVQEILILPGKNSTATLTPTNAEATESATLDEEATDSAEVEE